jgi:LysM repeat protein
MLSDRNKKMNMRDLLDKIDTLAEASGAPTSITPTHFHKSNVGTSLPLMMTEPGVFWWETSSADGEGNGGRSIQRCQGNTENRSKWNPASVDGVFVNGKPVEFPAGVTWKTYKSEEVKPANVTKPARPDQQDTKPVVNKPADDSNHTARLNALALQLQDKLNTQKVSNSDSTEKPAVVIPADKQDTKPSSEELYTIQRGDTLTKLANKFGTTIPELLKLNPQITNPNLIYAGKDLKIPSGKPAEEKAQAFEGVLAKELIESFGYDDQLDEYSLDQFGKDLGAGARGIGNGLTFGYGDNMLAGVKSGLGIEKDYKTALGKEMANTARSKAQASNWKFRDPILGKEWNPSVYDIGDTVGMVATPIPGSLAGRSATRAALAAGRGATAARAIGAGANVGANLATVVFANWMKNKHDKSTTGLTQDNVNTLASKPEVLKVVQQKLGLEPNGKISPETLDAIDKAKIFNEAKAMPLSESEKMAELRNKLQRLDEDTKTGVASKVLGKGVNAGERDLTAWLTRQGVKDADTLVGRQHGLPSAVKDPSSGIIVPSTAVRQPAPRVEPRVEPRVDSTARNTNVNTNTATGGTSSSTSAGGNSGVRNSGNSTNTISNNPVININIGAEKIATATRAVERDAGPVLAKELETVLKTGDKAKIGSWWQRNKTKAKWTSGTLGILAAIGLAGLIAGGRDDTAQDVKPETDPTVPPTDTTVVPPGPNVVPPGPNVAPPGPNVAPLGPTDRQDTKPDPEVEALIKQMQELMLAYEEDSSPAWSQATSNAQSLIDQAKGSKNTDQMASDRKAARAMPAAGTAQSTKPVTGASSANSDELQVSTNKKDPTNVAKGTTISK